MTQKLTKETKEQIDGLKQFIKYVDKNKKLCIQCRRPWYDGLCDCKIKKDTKFKQMQDLATKIYYSLDKKGISVEE